MRPTLSVLAFAAVLAVPAVPAAQGLGQVSATPPLTAAQVAAVQTELDAYRRDVDARFAAGTITLEEAKRLVEWRQFQLAQQAAGAAPPSQILAMQAQADTQRPLAGQYFLYDAPPPAVGWLWAVRPSVCAGGFSRGWGGSVCF